MPFAPPLSLALQAPVDARLEAPLLPALAGSFGAALPAITSRFPTPFEPSLVTSFLPSIVSLESAR